jgi:predicted Zn-dependent peptidase
MSDSYRKSVLSNGVRVITESIPSVRSISVGVWIGAGSRDESDADAGICHFIEHMVFKGTSKRRMHQIAQRMESVGGYLNAFTTKEYTCFYARALDEHLDRAIDTVCDLVARPTFPSRELEKEKDVVVEELKMYADNPEDYAFELLEKNLFDGHALGRPIIGFEETVRSFDQKRLFDFLEKQYTLDRIVVAVAGNADHDRVVRLVERAFSGIERDSTGSPPLLPGLYQPTTSKTPRPIQQAHLLLGRRAFDVHHEMRVTLSVLNTLLGGGMSSVLNQNIREKYGFCYNVYSFANMYSDTGDFGVYMGTDVKNLDRAQKLIFREFRKLVQTPISARKMKQVKNQVKGSIMLGLEGMGSRMMRIGRQELYYNRFYSLDEIMESVDSVSAVDIHAVASEIFKESAFSIVALYPDSGYRI